MISLTFLMLHKLKISDRPLTSRPQGAMLNLYLDLRRPTHWFWFQSYRATGLRYSSVFLKTYKGYQEFVAVGARPLTEVDCWGDSGEVSSSFRNFL